MAKSVVSKLVRELEEALQQHADHERAAQEKRYLKSALRFMGVGQPIIRREAKAFAKRHAGLTADDLQELAATLWETHTHELRSMAIGILEAKLAVLSAKDATWILRLVREAHTWAHVDWLAIKVLGPLITGQPKARAQLDVWAKDDDFWVRRTALLAWHDPLIKGEGDFAHFARLAVPMLHEKEFFIRKAIGWVLRSTAKKTPQRTIAFVREHARELSALSFREATRNLPPTQQHKLAALRGA